MAAPQDPLSVATRAVDLALTVGADAADAYAVSESRLSLALRSGELENLERAVSRGVALRLTLNHRTATVHTTDRSSYGLTTLAATALEIARALPEPREPVIFASPRPIEALPHPDPDLQGEPIEAKKRRLFEIEKAMLAVPGMTRSLSATWDEADGEIGIASSRGLSLYAPVCTIELGIEGIAQRDGASFTGGYRIEVPARRALPDPSEVGRRAAERAVELLGARSIPSTRAPVIFAPQTGRTLLTYLAAPLRGDYVVQKGSYLADKIGQVIAAPEVTIHDNPLLAQGASRRAFDAEGTPGRDLVLIHLGRLQSYLCDLAVGAKLGAPGGGNAVRRSYESRIEIGTSNFYMEPGTYTPEEIVKATDRGLLVTVLLGAPAGLSAAIDSFSLTAMGIWIEQGQRAYPVRGISIGGTICQMLGSIDRIGSDIEFTADTVAPTFRVAEMAISGT
jgi:PmbA protein